MYISGIPIQRPEHVTASASSVSTIKEPALRELVAASAVRSATIVGQHGGFVVMVSYGAGDRTLATTRGSIRLFATLDTAGAFVRGLGLPRFEVDLTRYEPARLRKPRPDRAEALKRTRTRMQQPKLI
jgi:hypothetical protein